MRAPVLALCALSSLVASAPARAEVVVTACADVGAGVEVSGSTSFDVLLQRDPALASGARLDFMAFDPDNLRGVEVEVRIDPAAYAVPALTNLTLGNGSAAFNDRSVSFSVDLPTSALSAGTNSVVFNDLDAESPFSLERVCLTLIGAPPPSVPPSSETFCADDVFAADPTEEGTGFDGGQSAAPGASATLDVDVPVSDAASVGLDLIAFVDSADAGAHVAGFNNGLLSLTQAFDADNGASDDQYRIVSGPTVFDLVTGGSAASPTTNVLGVQGDFQGHLWMACLVIEDDFPPPVVDAGAPEEDAGPVVDDAGAPEEDAGAPVEPDAGAPPPDEDAGGPPSRDAGSPPDEEDAGVITPPPDAGADPPRDAGGLEPNPDPAPDEERRAKAELTDPSFRVASTCTSTRASDAAPLGLALLVMLALRRRARRRRT